MPGGVGVIFRLEHGREKVVGEHGVEPGDDANINLRPLGVVAHVEGVGGAVDVVDEAKLEEGDVEEGSPGAKVGAVANIKGDGDMCIDVDELRCGRRDSHRWSREGVGVVGGAGAGGHVEHAGEDEEEKQRRWLGSWDD